MCTGLAQAGHRGRSSPGMVATARMSRTCVDSVDTMLCALASHNSSGETGSEQCFSRLSMDKATCFRIVQITAAEACFERDPVTDLLREKNNRRIAKRRGSYALLDIQRLASRSALGALPPQPYRSLASLYILSNAGGDGSPPHTICANHF